MITFSNGNYYTNQLNFNAKNNKKQNVNKRQVQQTQPTQPIEQHNKGVSKTVTGLLASTAFLVGLGTGQITKSAPEPKEEEKIELKENMPPSEARRDWYVTDKMTANGKEYDVRTHYIIQEIPFLVANRFIDKETNKVVQQDTLWGYEIFPKNAFYYGDKGELIESRQFQNFDQQYACPESGTIKNRKLDESLETTSLTYKINKKITNDKKTKTQPEIQQKTKSQPKQQQKKYPELNEDQQAIFDAFMSIGEN